MVIVLSEIRCPTCGKRLIKNPDCGGDYHQTVAGYRLQEYCNGNCKQNGVLRPLLEGYDPEYISNRRKEGFAVRIAHAKRLGIIESKKIARSCDTNNINEFLMVFAKKIQLPLMEVTNFLGVK